MRYGTRYGALPLGQEHHVCVHAVRSLDPIVIGIVDIDPAFFGRRGWLRWIRGGERLDWTFLNALVLAGFRCLAAFGPASSSFRCFRHIQLPDRTQGLLAGISP